jgi:hypothetical protein
LGLIDRGNNREPKIIIEELRNLYSSLNILRVMKSQSMRWTGLVARMGGMRSVYIPNMDWETSRKMSFWRPSHRLKNNIKMEPLN